MNTPPRLSCRDRLDDNGNIRRTCGKCGAEYPLDRDHFYSRANHFSGLDLICKACGRKKLAVEKAKMRKEAAERRPQREHLERAPVGGERRIAAIKAEVARRFDYWENVRPGGFAISAPGW